MLTKIGFVFALLCCVASAGYAQTLFIGNESGDRTTVHYDSTVPQLTFDVDDDTELDVIFSSSGDIEFIGALKPDGLSGTSGDILRSNGTSSPTWIDIQTLAWSKTGNSGTNATTNFVGTTDNNSLVFRTNNIARAELRNSTGSDDSGSFVPNVDNVYSLGAPDKRWKDLYLGPSSIRMGGFISGANGGQQPQSVTLDEVILSYSDGTLLIDKDIKLTGSMLPDANNLYSLGSNTNRWADIYVSGNSIHIGTSAAEATMSYDDDLELLHFSTNGANTPEITMGSGDNDGDGMLGIATTPNTSLDVNGDAAFRFSALTLGNGVNSGVDVGVSSAVRITGPTAAFEIHGITGGQDGKVVELYNASGNTMRIFNQSGEATAENRIVTGTGHSFEVRNLGAVRLVYSPTDNRWLLTSETRNTSNLVYTMNTYPTLTSNQTAWTPDFGYIAHRISSNSNNRSISGINSVDVQDGTTILLMNIGSNNIVLQNESNNADDETYRIITGTGNNETIAPNKPATLIYDRTSQRWRVISGR